MLLLFSACTQDSYTAEKRLGISKKFTLSSVQTFWTAVFICAWTLPTQASRLRHPQAQILRVAVDLRTQDRSASRRLHARLKARATRPLLPSLLLDNFCSRDNKMDKMRIRTTSQHDIRECCAVIFTETWTAHLPWVKKKGDRVCVYCTSTTDGVWTSWW